MKLIELFEYVIADVDMENYTLPVIADPSSKDLQKILNRTEYSTARFLLMKNGDLLLFDGGILVHWDVITEMNLNGDDVIAGGTIDRIEETLQRHLERRKRIERYNDGSKLWTPNDLKYYDADYKVGYADFPPPSRDIVNNNEKFKRMIRGVNVTTITGEFK